MDKSILLIGLITGSVGTGYLIYGSKQRKLVPLMAGLGLILVPYIIDGSILLSIACLILAALPFVFKSDY
jgi:hypothetical protein